MPKTAGARHIEEFRPISLINDILKIISKVLACRLKTKIGQLIDPAQSAFLNGRSILDSVVTAHEIMTFCVKHKWPAFFLKIDFARAFDTIDWFFLFKVLQARGFGVRWCGWISSLALASPLSLLMVIQESLSDANMV